jgi:pilus assembly protein FimV
VVAEQKPAEAAKVVPSAAPSAPAEPLVKAQVDAPSAPTATDTKKPAEPEKPVAAKVDQPPPVTTPSSQAAPTTESQPATAAQTAQPAAATPAQETAKPQEAKPEATKVAETKPAEKPAEVATEQAKPKKPKKATPPPPPPPEPDLIEEFGGLIGGALAAIVLAVLGLFGFKRWKKGREAQAEAEVAVGSEADTELSFEDAFGDEEQDVTDKRQAAGVATPTLAPAGPVTQREEPRRSAAVPAVEEDTAEDKTQFDLGDIFESAEPEVPAPATSAKAADSDDTPDDIMGEADVYAAFGDYDQAATAMRNAIAGSPGKAMYKVKLLEIYRDAGDKASFQKAYGEFASGLSGRQAARAEEMAKAMGVSATAGGAFVDTVSALDTQRMSAPPASSVSNLSDTQEVDFDLDMSGANSQTGGHLDTLVMGEAPKLGSAEVADTVEYGGGMPNFADTAVLSHSGGASPAMGGDSDMLPDTVEMGGALSGQSDSAPSPALSDTAETSGDSLEFDLNLASLGTPSLEEAKPDLAMDDSNLLSFDVDSPTVVMDPAKESRPVDAAADLGLDMGLDFSLEPTAADVREPEKAPVADDSTMLLLDDAPADAAPPSGVSEELSLGSLALEGDEVATKLDLARAYIDMGDPDAAKDILGEVLSEGNTAQQQEAQKLMSQIGA